MASEQPPAEDVRQPLLGARDDGQQAEPVNQRGTFAPSLGAAAAFGILVSIVIGSGVFTSPGAIDTNVPSPGMALVMWLVGGILAWSGASTLAELGTAIPGEGGVQPYLQYIFGDIFGFLAAWTWILTVMPATLAILSIVFVESIYSALGTTDQAGTLLHKLLAILVLLVVSLANCISTKTSTRLSGFFLGTKFSSIILIVAAGLAVIVLQVARPERKDIGGRDWYTKPWFGNRQTLNPDGSTTDWDQLNSWELLGHLSAAVYGALWAYSGWDKAIYISSELKNPGKQLPLTINTAIPTIFLCFIVANAAYYILLPWDTVSTSDSVAVTAISRPPGGQVRHHRRRVDLPRHRRLYPGQLPSCRPHDRLGRQQGLVPAILRHCRPHRLPREARRLRRFPGPVWIRRPHQRRLAVRRRVRRVHCGWQLP
uniref:Amino acid permease/ SLC12A domain-containing protein n=1 Tax=Bionectria ochroleuca TaxID=29856 RepID=A0A8H7KC00_BIOOC